MQISINKELNKADILLISEGSEVLGSIPLRSSNEIESLISELKDWIDARKNPALESEMTPELIKQYEDSAKAEREGGGSIEIHDLYIAIEMSDGSEYFFQEEEADELLKEVPDEVYAEDYLLAIAQNW